MTDKNHRLNRDFYEQIKSIRCKISPDLPVVVEGKKDKSALEKLGFLKVVDISGKTDETVVEILRKRRVKEVAILTDFDREGKERCGRLVHLIERSGIKVNHFARRLLAKTLKLHQIEEINSLMKSL